MNDFYIKRDAWCKLVCKCPAFIRSKGLIDLKLTPKGNYIHVSMGEFINLKEHIDDFPSDELIGKFWLLVP